ncbi:MAG: hypothetical protein H6661_02030 [Ardenticatenaceae bacterium]|nr:hypothetical protein [Ardenticatenaceae bacterium]
MQTNEETMSFREKNITVSLISFTLILVFYSLRLLQIVRTGFEAGSVFRLWGVVIVLTIVMIIAGTILAHIFSAILEAIRTGEEPTEIEDLQDERDQLIDLRGTRVSYTVSSIGVFLAMLSFVLGQPPLVMFTLLIFAGLMAQIIGDIARLVLYRWGF